MAIGTGAAILGSAAIGALASKGGSKQGGTTTASNAPWAPAHDYLGDGMQKAQSLYYNQSPLLQQGVNAQAQRAQQGNPLNQAAQGNAMQTLQGDFLGPNSNPYLRDTVNQAMGDARSQINGQFAGDNYGSSAHQEWLSKGLMQQALPMYNQNYQSERQRQMGAQALSPTLANQDYMDIGQLQAAGNSQWDQLGRYQGLIQNTAGMGGTQSQPYFQNNAASMMGGALGGMALYNGMNQGGLLGGSSPQYTGYGMQGDYQYG